MRFPEFLGGSSVEQSPIADQEQTWNWYPEVAETKGATSPGALYPTPGVQTFARVTDAPCRGSLQVDGRALFVMGTKLYEVFADGTTTNRGTVALDANPATLCANGDGGGQVFITSGNNGYIFDLNANTLTLVRSGATTMGAFQGGYFIALDAATSTFFLSDLLDGTTWDPTQFGQRSLAADGWVSMAVNYTEIWLFGSSTSEAWVNQGTFPFPYAPHPSGFIPYGVTAPFSVHAVAGALMWLGQTGDGEGSVIRLLGFTPNDVATRALAVALNGYQDTIDDAIADTYDEFGHTFYILTFPRAGVTWVYDLTTGKWANRGTWNSDVSAFEAWRPLYHCFAFSKHLIGDRETGTIYELSSSVSTDVDGLPIRRMRRTPALLKDNQRLRFAWFELLLEVGLGLTSGQGSTPLVMLRLSNDGGKTWGTERTASAGAIGAYRQRVYWTRCGSARNRVFEVSVSDPIPWRIIDAFVRIEGEGVAA